MAAHPLAHDDLAQVLQQTAELWAELRGARIFITGGTGFFGCWLLESFCHANAVLGLEAEAVVLTRDPQAFRDQLPHITRRPEITLLPGDVRSFPFPQGEFLFVIHAATSVSGDRLDASNDMYQMMAEGTARVLLFARQHGTRKFLLASSGAIHGPQPDSMTHVPETFAGGPDPLDPRSAYAEGKRASEHLCALSATDAAFECKIARCWTFCGPHLPLTGRYAIGNFIGDALKGQNIQVKGDGTARRSYLYAADLAAWLWTMLFKAPALVPVNIGSSVDISILELAQLVARVLGSSIRVERAVEPTAGAAAHRYVPSVDRAATMLGLYPSVSLEESIRRTAQWHGHRFSR